MLSIVLSLTYTDGECLQQLYGLSNGQAWTVNTNWDGLNECTYFGITCENFEVTSINLPANNLVGTIPSCLFSMTGLKQLNLANNKFTDALFDMGLLEHLSTVNIENCHFTSVNYDVDAVSTSINLRNNDLSKVSIKFVNSQLITKLDLTNTSISGSFDIIDFAKLVDFSAAHTNIALKISAFPEFLRSLDVSFTPTSMDVEKLYTLLNKSTVSIIGFKRTQLYGKAPAPTPFMVSDLSENAFVCRDDSKSMFDCTFLQIKGLYYFVAKKQLKVQIESNTRLPNMPMEFISQLNLYVRDLQTSNATVTNVVKLTKCTPTTTEPWVYYLQCDCDQEIKNKEDIAVVYQDKAVSTGSLLVVKEVNELLANAGEGADYFQRKNMKRIDYQTKIVREEQPKLIKAESHNPVKAAKVMQIHVTAYSKCPDYISFVKEFYEPFTTKYALLAKYIQFNYVSMAKAAPMNVVKASSMHGQYEAHMDAVYACTQKYSPENFWDSQICFADSDSCLVENIVDRDTVASIELCAVEEEGMNILIENDEWLQEQGATWSPSLFMNNRPFCLWRATKTKPEEDCGNLFKDIDEFAKLICRNMVFHSVQECAELK
ncbi:Conserved_hypothetical protein [Hexamita inflata]|uniref:Uncharacterized protein n=1 Tax=Hexamita inflata TaxID=28002 RepID=A0AA86NH11_9EUKA|nr:Conserved hypothetical protein [Hexamita inflata]